MRKSVVTSLLDPMTLRSWPVFLVALLWSGVIHFLDVMTNSPGNYTLRAGVVLLAHIPTFAGVWLAVGVIRRLPPYAASLAMIAVAIVFGMVRGVIFAYLLYWAGLDLVPLVAYRFFGGPSSVTLPMLITAVIVKKVRDFQKTRSQLLTETSQLESALDEARDQLKQDTLRRSETIRETILASLKRWDGRSANEAATTIQQTMDDIVRPLSHRLDSDESSWSPTERAQEAAKVNWREALTGIFEPRNLSPLAISLTATGFGINFLFRHQTPSEALYALAVILFLGWVCFWGLRRILSWTSSAAPALLPAVYLAGVLLIAGIIGAAISPIRADREDPHALLYYSFIFMFAFAAVFSIAFSASEQAREANSRLADTTAQVAWEVARVSEELRQARQRMARELHGRVQAGFLASLMKLRKAIDADSEDIEKLTDNTVRELEKIVSSIGSSKTGTRQDLERTFSEVDETWAGVASIDLDTTNIALSDIGEDQVVSHTLADLIPELVFNAIRHGHATQVSFVVSLDGPGILSVVCRDNGTGHSASSKVGLGTKLLDSCSLHWHRYRDDTSTVTQLTLPFAPQ
jgi:signal transduction histidine kinase